MKATVHPRVSKAPAKAKSTKSPARPAARSRDPQVSVPPTQPAGDAERRELIAIAAYLRAEKRGFAPGLELDDWLAAESEINGQPLLEHQLAHSDT